MDGSQNLWDHQRNRCGGSVAKDKSHEDTMSSRLGMGSVGESGTKAEPEILLLAGLISCLWKVDISTAGSTILPQVAPLGFNALMSLAPIKIGDSV